MRAITEQESAQFEALISGEYDNFVLVSTELDGEETVTIATITRAGADFDIMPLYVAVTPAMFSRLVDPGKEAMS